MHALLLLAAMAPSAREKTIVLVMLDDFGWKDDRRYGNGMLPEIDRLRSQGSLVTNLYGAPSCKPSRLAFLAGIRRVTQDRFLNCNTFGNSFQAAGWHTVYGGKTNVFVPNAHTGWDQYLEGVGETQYDIDRDLADKATAVIKDEKIGKLLIVVCLLQPHEPHSGPESLRLDGTAYSGAIAGASKVLGAINDATPSGGVLWAWSDNGGGPKADNGKLREGKHSVYDGGVRVRSWLRGPGILPTSRLETLMGVEDIPRTAAGILGENIQTHGIDVRHETRKYLSYSDGKKGFVRDQRWKLISTGKREELYDILSDPRESKDLWKSKPNTRRRLRRELQ